MHDEYIPSLTSIDRANFNKSIELRNLLFFPEAGLSHVRPKAFSASDVLTSSSALEIINFPELDKRRTIHRLEIGQVKTLSNQKKKRRREEEGK